MTNESNFPAVFFEDFLAALRKVQDENRIHGNVEVFELRPSPDGAVHLGVSWPSIGTVPPEEAKKFAEEVVIQLKRDIREYVHRDSDYRIVRDGLDSFVELVELPDYTADYSEERALLWFKMYRSYRLFDELGCGGQFFTTGVKLFRRRGRWYAYHFVSVDM